MDGLDIFEDTSNSPVPELPGKSCPVHKLPLALLSYLFGFVPDSYHKETVCEIHSDLYEVADSALMPWLPVSLVCRDWHDTVMSTPVLWGVIIVQPVSRSPFHRIRRQLEQSKSVPIDIHIHMENPDPDIDPYSSSFVPVLCDLLLSHIHRWRSIDVRVALATHMYEILDTIPSSCPPIASKLTSVKLTFRKDTRWHHLHDRDYTSPRHLVLFGSSAPHLRNISVTGVNVDWKQPWVSSASKLTTLEIKVTRRGEDSPSWSQFAAVLRGAPQLKVLVLHNGYESVDPAWVDPNSGSMPGDDHTTPIALPELRQLEMYLPAAVMVQLLRRCYIPALEGLSMYPSFHHPNCRASGALVAQLVAPLAFVGTGTCSQVQVPGTRAPSRSLLAGVRYLCIRWNEPRPFFTPDHIATLYAELNQVTLLALDLTDNPAFTNLLFTPTRRRCDVRLPQLRCLSIRSDTTLHHWDVRRICALAAHRKDMGVPLRELILMGVQGRFPDESLSWCQENLETFYFTSDSYQDA